MFTEHKTLAWSSSAIPAQFGSFNRIEMLCDRKVDFLTELGYCDLVPNIRTFDHLKHIEGWNYPKLIATKKCL